MSLSADQQKALKTLESLGIDPVELVKQAGLANVQIRQRASFEVIVNDEDNRKYGDVTIYKVQSNGFRAPKVGIAKTDLADLIERLQKAATQLA